MHFCRFAAAMKASSLSEKVHIMPLPHIPNTAYLSWQSCAEQSHAKVVSILIISELAKWVLTSLGMSSSKVDGRRPPKLSTLTEMAPATFGWLKCHVTTRSCRAKTSRANLSSAEQCTTCEQASSIVWTGVPAPWRLCWLMRRWNLGLQHDQKSG